MVETLDKLD